MAASSVFPTVKIYARGKLRRNSKTGQSLENALELTEMHAAAN